MHVPIAREGILFILAAVALAALAWLAFALWGGRVALALAAITSALALAMIGFFRDPRRTGPRGPELVTAPADGRVVDVSEIEEPDYLGSTAVRVSIFLSLLDVHVNRYPVSGRVEQRRYRRGGYEPAWRESAARRNESVSLGIRTDGGRVLVRQVAGLVARRIVTYGEQGDAVRQGERMGIIRFGSRADVFLPSGSTVEVSVGQRAVGGVTVLARLPDRASAAS